MRCLVNWKTFRSRLLGAGHASPCLASPSEPRRAVAKVTTFLLVLLSPSVCTLLLLLLLLLLLAVVVAAARHNGVVIILALKRINTLQWTLNVNRSLGNLPANNNNNSLTIVLPILSRLICLSTLASPCSSSLSLSLCSSLS